MLGRYNLESPDSVPPEGVTRDATSTPSSERARSARGDQSVYRIFGSSLYLRLLLEKPLVEKAKIDLVIMSSIDG